MHLKFEQLVLQYVHNFPVQNYTTLYNSYHISIKDIQLRDDNVLLSVWIPLITDVMLIWIRNLTICP